MEYECTYCNHAFYSNNPYYLISRGGNRKIGIFCLPECALAFYKYKTSPVYDNTQELFKLWGRKAFPAPPPNIIRNIPRDIWVKKCFSQLDERDKKAAMDEKNCLNQKYRK